MSDVETFNLVVELTFVGVEEDVTPTEDRIADLLEEEFPHLKWISVERKEAYGE